MVGDAADEHARATLAVMQSRLASGPHAALGVAPTANAADIRSAFLTLTKTYHPARFGRHTPEIQRLANEVFLGLKAAHEHVAKAANAVSGRIPVMPPGSATSSSVPTPVPPPPAVGRAPSPQPPHRPSQAIQAIKPSQSSGVPTFVPPQGSGSGPNTRRMSASQAPLQRPSAPSIPTSTSQQPPLPPAPTPAVSRPLRPTAGHAPLARPHPVTARQPPTAPPPPMTARTPTGPSADDRAELVAIMQLVRRGEWTGARLALQTLAARLPGAKTYQALLAYARGREAQQAGRNDDAIAELTRAVALDPDLVLAKSALAELQARRK